MGVGCGVEVESRVFQVGWGQGCFKCKVECGVGVVSVMRLRWGQKCFRCGVECGVGWCQ